MREFSDASGDSTLSWPGTGFIRDAEPVQPYVDVSDSIEWGVQDGATSKKSSRTSQICSGPRLIPKIRMQDQALEASAVLHHNFNAGLRPFNSEPPLERHVDHSTITASSRLTPDNGLYHIFAPQRYSSEQAQRATPYSPPEFAPANLWPHTPEDDCNYLSPINGPYPSLSDYFADGPYLVHGGQSLPFHPDSSDHQNSPLARKSFKAVPSVKANDLHMYPSSLPRGVPDLVHKSHRSLHQMPMLSMAGQSHISKGTSLLDYLSLPNPALSLVERVVEPGPGRDRHFFFDVRNVRSWSAFSLETMLGVSELRSLLDREVPCDTLPASQPVGTSPVTREQLHLAYRDHFEIKLNAALNSTLAQQVLQMRSSLGDSSPTLPDFFASALQSQEQIRVVGIVLCYEQWRSDMRHGTPREQVRYLSGLARLQHFFREHGCRYGFIITEIELVCVRYGGDDLIHESKRPESCPSFTQVSSSAPIPIFGYMEVSNAVALSEQHTRNGKDRKMTAGLALWYLHMQAGDEPLPGHQHWRLDIGKPSAMTRKKHLLRDMWMPKPVLVETRRAKRIRGWIWPNEDFSKREVGRGRRPILGK
ncbi:hypothetical protein QM012_009502 [Aureobasidium pullulans]|uniref:Sialidase n=1 Tax=Aureobasidium pullulans TaxID=5580 RepID=A0ABR0TI40_AURPU